MKLLSIISALSIATASVSSAQVEVDADKIINTLQLDGNLKGLLTQVVPRTQTYQIVRKKCAFSHGTLFRTGIVKAQEKHSEEWKMGITHALRSSYGDAWIAETSELTKDEMLSAFRNIQSLNSYGVHMQENIGETLQSAVTTVIEYMWSECSEKN